MGLILLLIVLNGTLKSVKLPSHKAQNRKGIKSAVGTARNGMAQYG
jgi:hypothetical protein